MPELAALVAHLDQLLETRAITDYPGAHNGLQLENSGAVTLVAAAVDSSEVILQTAVEQGADLLLVHHGLLWQTQRYVGANYRKLKAAMAGNLAIYSSHLPLDLHPMLGNNAELGRAIGLENGEPAFPMKGRAIGLKFAADVSREELHQRLERALGEKAHLCPGGPSQCRRIGILTGGGGTEIPQALAEGVDTLITGEGPHWSYTLAEELGLNVFYGGHYATETFGVKALAAHLKREFGLPWLFIDHPTGL